MLTRLLAALFAVFLLLAPVASVEAQQTTTTDAPNVAEEPLPDDGEGSAAWLLVLMTIIVVAMVVLAVAFVRGRRPPA